MKKILKIVIFIMISFLLISTVKADSGWDSGYDSGGSSGGYSGGGYSGGDYSGGHSYDFGDNNHSTSPFELPFLIIIFVIGIATKIDKESKKEIHFTGFKNYIRKEYRDISEKEYDALAIDKDIDEVKALLKKEINTMLKAYSDFDYEVLRSICSPDLSEKYIEELEFLKSKNQQRFYKDLEYKLFYIIDAYRDENVVCFMIYSKESLIDYKSDNDGNLVSGTSEYKISDNFLIEFEYNIETRKLVIVKCKNINKENILE